MKEIDTAKGAIRKRTRRTGIPLNQSPTTPKGAAESAKPIKGKTKEGTAKTETVIAKATKVGAAGTGTKPPEKPILKIAKADYDPDKETGSKPSIIKEGMTKALCDALMAGNTVRNSCALAGIDETTYYRYRQEGKRAEEGSPLWEFCQSVKKALADAEHRNVLVIQTAAKKNWQASAWFLERRYPKEWGRNDRLKVGSDEDNPLIVGTLPLTEKSLTDGGALAALKAVLKRKPELLAATA